MFGKHIIESKRKSKDLPKTVVNEASRATTLATTKEEPFPRNEKTAIPWCLLCSRGHELGKCEEFKKRSYEE